MLEYMLDTNICTYVTKNYPVELLNRFGQLSEHVCMAWKRRLITGSSERNFNETGDSPDRWTC